MTSRTRAAHGTIVAYLALFVALSGTGAYAVDKIGSGGIKDNAIKTRHIGSGQVKVADLGAGSVNGAKVANNSLTGADINEATIGMGVLTGRAESSPESTRYVAPSGTTTATHEQAEQAAHLSPSVPARAADLTVSAVVGQGSELIVTLMVDGVASSAGCTIAPPATTCTDEEDSAFMPAGSGLSVRVQVSGSSPTDIQFSMTVSPSVG